MEIHFDSPPQDLIIGFSVLIAAAGAAHAVLKILVTILASFIVYSRWSIKTVRLWILALKGLSCFLLTVVLLSFGKAIMLSVLIALILCCGDELDDHLRKRTTAAFSTSDGQNQRMFNLSLLGMIACGLLAGLTGFVGLNPVPRSFSVDLEKAAHYPLTQLILVVGIFFFLKRFVLLLQHARTLGYLIRSYVMTLKQGKLKRLW